MFRYFSIFTSRFSLHSRFLLLTSTRIISMFAKKLTQESKKCPAAIRFRFFPWYRRDGLHVLSYNHTDTGACRAGLYSGRLEMESVTVAIAADRIFMFVCLFFEYAGYLRAGGSLERKDKYGYGL